jgi:hypothetical protein
MIIQILKVDLNYKSESTHLGHHCWDTNNRLQVNLFAEKIDMALLITALMRQCPRTPIKNHDHKNIK